MIDTKKISINIVTWNSRGFIENCLVSIFAQDFDDYEVIVVDNNSTDGTLEFIKANYPQVKLIENKKNTGFSFAHNQGISVNNSEFVLVTNPDIILDSDFLKSIYQTAKSYTDGGAFGGKVLKIINNPEGENSILKTNIIDSCGLEIFKNRKVSERGVGEKDVGQYNVFKETFGISGALVLLKRTALNDVAMEKNEFFDNDFFAYKEDIDLCWRLRHRGWKCYYQPLSLAYHFRKASEPYKKLSLFQTIKNHKLKSCAINKYSYRNHLFLLYKNEHLFNFFRDFMFISIYEVKKLAYIIFFEPKNIGQLFKITASIKRFYTKRKNVFTRSKMTANNLRTWIN